jgi:hypothetical protein
MWPALGALFRAARRGRRLAGSAMVVERHFNAGVHVVWCIIGPLTFPLDVAPADHTLPVRSAVRTLVAVLASVHLLAWRANTPRISLDAHVWLMAAYAAIFVVSQLVLYGAADNIHQVEL